MKELVCEGCGDTFILDWNDTNTSRKVCRQCEADV